MIRIEEVDESLWIEYAQEVLDGIDKINEIRKKWESNPNPTADFLSDIRVELANASSDLNDQMRGAVLCEPIWEAKVHASKRESMDNARQQCSTATEANAIYKSFEPYNSALQTHRTLKRVIDLAYSKIEQTRNLTNTLSNRTRDAYSSPSQPYF